ncbi:hypothetical protein GCM10009765_83020 [Fodinicola feengrottensis]|uniref:Uncharacterized protein n=1 Tax=Fodinicola feengrottensis TaxID=435914 RepID=A0ABP4VGK7_9ACTN
MSQSWFYKWRDRPPAQARRERLDAAVKDVFEESGDHVRVAAGARRAGGGRVAGWGEHRG